MKNPMSKFSTFIKLILIMTSVSFLGIGITTVFLYRDEVHKQGVRLEETARRFKRGALSLVAYHIKSVEEDTHNKKYKDSAEYVRSESIAQMKGAVSSGVGNDDIEVTVGYLKNNQIQWISQSFQAESLYVPIDMGHIWAVPMQLALQEKEGLIKDKDYQGRDVLAAYTYIASVKVGIVVKTYTEIIRNRFIRGALFSSIPGVFLIFLGVAAFTHVSRPIIGKLEDDNEILRKIRGEKIATEKVLIETQHRLTCFYEGAFEGLAVTRDGQFLDGNSRFLDMFGYSYQEMIGMAVCNFVHEDDQELVFTNINREYTLPYQHKALHKDGSVRYVEVCGRSTQYHGKPARVTAIHDITDRVLAEEQISKLNDHQRQVSKMEAIGNFASGIAHDFNNALQPVVGHCDILLQKMKADDPIRMHILKIITSAETASLLVHRIQSFAHTKDEDSLGLLKLPNCLKQTFDFLRSMTPTSISMELFIEEGLGLVAATDITIRQVLMNLCKNSAQAMTNKEGRITITVSNEIIHVERYGLKKGPHVKIEVEDNGCGMDQDTLDQALDPYFTTKKVTEGTGIGLSVVNGIIRSYGGFIHLYSEQDQGTRGLNLYSFCG